MIPSSEQYFQVIYFFIQACLNRIVWPNVSLLNEHSKYTISDHMIGYPYIVICNYVTPSFSVTDEFVGPTPNIWRNGGAEGCSTVGTHKFIDGLQCVEKCKETTGCTAVAFNFKSPTTCKLRGCPLPVPTPLTHRPDWTGYYLKRE